MNRRRTFSKQKLYMENERIFFKEIIEVGKTYQYYHRHYLYIDVEKIAEKYGVKICNIPTSNSGTYNFKVISMPDVPTQTSEQKEAVLFDVNELAV
jgi:hypothetical protein